MNSQHAPNCCPAPAIAGEGQCQDAADIFAALSDVTRLQLALFIYRCSPNPVCACSFPEVFNISRSTISHHLTRLVNAGILGREQQGKWAYYSIAPDFDTRLLDVVPKPRASTTHKPKGSHRDQNPFCLQTKRWSLTNGSCHCARTSQL